MDKSLIELRRRFYADPSDEQALNAYARGLAAMGREADAYNFLFDHGALEREDDFAFDLGARLSAMEDPLLKLKLGQGSAFASRTKMVSGQKAWDYSDFREIRATRLPVLAIQVKGSKPVSKTLLKKLGAFPALRLFFINQARGLTNKSLCSIPPLPSLRHLALSFANIHSKNEVIERETFKHLCSLASLETLRVNGCNMAAKDHELCALQPHLKALYLSVSKTEREHIEFLSEFSQLKCLSLHFPQYTDEVLPEITETLESLEFYEIFHGGACLRSLSLPQITHLSLKNSRISDDDLESVAELKTLTTLELEGNPKITNKGLEALASLPKLEQLSLRYCIGLNEGALRPLAKLNALKVLLLPQDISEDAAARAFRERSDLKFSVGSAFERYWHLKSSLWRQCLGRPS